jgi:hypothetical protein
MAVKIREKQRLFLELGVLSLMRRQIVALGLASLAGCAAPQPRPEPAVLEARAVLPPHVVEVAEGLFSCERGYLIKQGRCVPFEELEHGPVVEVSSLPSAGEGPPGTCPSSGCGSSYSAPFSSTLVYSGAGQYGYYGASWPWFSNGWICAPRARRFRGGELASSGSFASFIQERRFAAAEFIGARLGLQSSAGRRSQSRGRFIGNRAGRWK